MGYIRDEDFLKLVEIIRPSGEGQRIDVLCHRVEEMDQMMRYMRTLEQREEEPEEGFLPLMMEKWVALCEFARACVYLRNEPHESTIPDMVREWFEDVIEQKVGHPIELTHIQELTEEEFQSYMRAGPNTAEVNTESGEIDEMGEFKPNPFFQADGTTYPNVESIREPGQPGIRFVHKPRVSPGEEAMRGVTDQVGENVTRFLDSLDQKYGTRPTPESE